MGAPCEELLAVSMTTIDPPRSVMYALDVAVLTATPNDDGATWIGKPTI